jgi:hypothetical protein
MASFNIKRNDTAPAITATLTDSAGTAVSLTGATVRFHMRPNLDTTMKVDAAATVDDAAAGEVSYSWQTGDTDTTGYFQAEWEVTFSDLTIRTFPTTNYTIVRIVSDLA